MITVRLDSAVPLEEQIFQEIRHAIARGRVGTGQELPSVRQLGSDLGVHWNTVARAYRRLRDEGLVVVGHGRGVVVRELNRSERPSASVVRANVQRKVEEVLTEGQLGGLSLDEIRDIFLERLRASDPGKEKR